MGNERFKKKSIVSVVLFLMIAMFSFVSAHHVGNNPFYGNTNEDQVHNGTDYDSDEWNITYTDPENMGGNSDDDTGNTQGDS